MWVCKRKSPLSECLSIALTAQHAQVRCCPQMLQEDTEINNNRQEDKLLFIAGITQGRRNQPQPRKTSCGAFPEGQGSGSFCPQRLHRAQQGRCHLQRDGRGGSESRAVPRHTVGGGWVCGVAIGWMQAMGPEQIPHPTGPQERVAGGQVTLSLGHCCSAPQQACLLSQALVEGEILGILLALCGGAL